jgi:PAT family beta-lactamase induction signal transducer AmpG
VTTPGRAETARLHARLALLYLASGMPLSLVTETVPQWLGRSGASLSAVATVPSRASLAWTLKFLWAPAVDATRRRRPWIVGAMAAIAALLAALAAGVEGAGTWAVAGVVLAIALSSATLDLGADGWTIDQVPKDRLGPANAVRVAAYRIGMAVAAGGLALVAGGFGWPAAFAVGAALYVVLALSTLGLREAPRARPTGPPLVAALGEVVSRPRAAVFLAFVFLFKLGDYALAVLQKPFQQAAGLSDAEMGGLATAGIVATIAGVALGGVATRRMGLFRALWVLGLFQATSNLAYLWAAASGDVAVVRFAAVFEPFCGGLGTAPFLAWLMASCAPGYAATQFAVFTAVMGLGRVLAGEAAASLVSAHGYAAYFGITFLLALPAYALLPWIPPEGRASSPLSREAAER